MSAGGMTFDGGLGAGSSAAGGVTGAVRAANATASIPAHAPTILQGDGAAGGAASGSGQGQWEMAWYSFRSHRMAFYSAIILVTMILSCIFLPMVLVSPTDIDMDLLGAYPPSMEHPLGTDQIGRDVFSRLVSAGRVSLFIGFTVAFISAIIGSIVGVAAGYFKGKTDAALMWFVNVLMTLPGLPLLIALSVIVATPDSKLGAILGGSEALRISLVLAFLGWMGISRMVRSKVMSLSEQEFVEAALALGSGHRRVMFVHILPNTISVLAVFTTLAVSGAIMAESALSFLGVGVNPPTATWGNMLSEARDLFTILEYWWLTVFPALAIFVTVLSVNFIGDGIRDALDPRAMKR